MGKNGIKWERGRRVKLTEHNVPELRIKNPSLENYIYVATLAKEGRRSIPKQLELIIEGYKKFQQQ